jgi:hypothetical protein
MSVGGAARTSANGGDSHVTSTRPPSTSAGSGSRRSSGDSPASVLSSVTTALRAADVVHATRLPFDPGSPEPSKCGFAVRRGGVLEPGALASSEKLQAKAVLNSSIAFCVNAQRDLSLSGGASFMAGTCSRWASPLDRRIRLAPETTKATRGSPSLQAALRLSVQRMRRPARAGARPVRLRLSRAAIRQGDTEAAVAASGWNGLMLKSVVIGSRPGL